MAGAQQNYDYAKKNLLFSVSVYTQKEEQGEGDG